MLYIFFYFSSFARSYVLCVDLVHFYCCYFVQYIAFCPFYCWAIWDVSSLNYMDNAAMNILTYFFWFSVCILGYITRNTIAHTWDKYIYLFIFNLNAMLFSKVVYQFTFPFEWEFLLLHVLINTWFCHSFQFLHFLLAWLIGTNGLLFLH